MFPYAPFPQAPKNLQQAINPWSWWLNASASDNQNSLININNYKGNHQLEHRITHEVAGYGSQLDAIEQVLSLVLKTLPITNLNDEQKKQISEFNVMMKNIQAEKDKALLEQFSSGGIDHLIEQLNALKDKNPNLYNSVTNRIKDAI